MDQTQIALPTPASRALAALLGPSGFLEGTDIPARNLRDASILPARSTLAVLRPATTREVAGALRICAEHRVRVTIQGGMTGLSGGAIPDPAGVALSLERLRDEPQVDARNATLTTLAGTTLHEVQQAAESAGFTYPVDLNARASCTIGGTVATNAGGNRVLRYGMTRAHVIGLEAVLADGRILTDMRGLPKNNAGFELRQLFIGSEGQYGVVTRVMLRLSPRLPFAGGAIVGFPDFAGLQDCLASARAELGDLLTAFEAMWPDYWDIVTNSGLGHRSPLSDAHGLYALIEVQGHDTEHAAFMRWLENGFERGLFADAAVATSGRDLDDFWALREAAAELSRVTGKCLGFDIGTSPALAGPFVEACRRALARDCPEVSPLFFGHVGDGNTHIMLVHPDGWPPALIERSDATIYAVAASFEGTVTAEHGVGMLKRKWLPSVRSPVEIDLMRTLKHALDPHGILNPDKVLPAAEA